MNPKGVENIAYLIKQAKKNNQPKPIVFIGAGVSRTAGIPLAGEITDKILSDHKDKPEIKALNEEEIKDYYKVMGCLNPSERHRLLRAYITDETRVKINVAHIYLAQLLKEGYVDYILTVNFDDLMLRSSALFNYLPPVYDIAVLKDFTTTSLQEKSVIYLHGQHHGLWLLNTEDELAKIRKSMSNILSQICNQRSWIVVGYSGDDPILNDVASLGRFDNELFWVGYQEELPGSKVQRFLNTTNNNTNLVSGYDADSFFLKLHAELGLDTPEIFNKPFSFLNGVMKNIKDIEEKLERSDEHQTMFKNIKQRYETSKEWVKDALNRYEESGEELKLSSDEIEIGKIMQEIIEVMAKEQFETKAEKLLIKYQNLDHKHIKVVLAELYTNWGRKIREMANLKSDRLLYEKSFNKFSKALELNPKSYQTLNSWGIALSELAELELNEKLHLESFEKFATALEINPTRSSIYYNWGNTLVNLANIKSDESLYKLSFEKYSKAEELGYASDSLFYNWGMALAELAQLKEDESLYIESFTKFEKAVSLDPLKYKALINWGNAVLELARFKKDEALYKEGFELYARASEIEAQKDMAFSNWGTALSELAELKSDKNLFNESFEKFAKALAINPLNDLTFYVWGGALTQYAKLFTGDFKKDILLKAKEKLETGISLGSSSYNLACCYALLGNHLEALDLLSKSLNNNEINIDEVLEDADWNDYKSDPEFLELTKRI